MDVIRNRDKKWEREPRIKRLLKGIQMISRLEQVFGMVPDELLDVEWFVLGQFPVYEGAVVDGDLTDEYSDFEDSIPDLTIDELYKRVMKPCNYKEENT